ncbi:hypothetical protein [Streptomyces sp. 4F14]|uniref:hypothetical protein n=1 Tax=Streptomyces sp. 4F14 TaxID=3394380 RepID=UPI003A8BA09E
MPTDEGTHGVDADGSRERTGPRHAAPRKPLLARLHVPAGKAIALAAMPTVLVGMGLTSTLARAEGQQPVSSKSLTAEEYQACVEAMAKDPDASPSPSASESSGSSSSDDDKKDDKASGKDSAASDSGSDEKGSAGSDEKASDDKAVSPSPSPTASGGGTEESGGGAGASPSPSPSASAPASEESKGLLETIGDAITDVFTGGGDSSTPSASPSPSASPGADSAAAGKKEATDKDAGGTEKESPAADDKASPSPSPSAGESSGSSDGDQKDDGKKDEDEKEADASPSPSPSASTDVDDCPAAATDDEAAGIDNKMRLPDDPWYLNASGLTLKGADYQGVVKVKTANGTVKEVLKYVISDGTDIDDLHQTVIDKQAAKTYHVKGAKGSKSTITGGDTVMYTESISGNLFGLLPVTFSPKSPPPLNIPWIYFSNVKVTQAGQFGGTLTIPGMTQSIT